ncbi:DNA-directed RNA polymerase subunit [Trypanosoma rangeli]|uniref:DNA-directed RNA polymerases I, II, and III subunit RPABC5 n=1 Tax=Trypanosoma rangeli TaxID=5698 RepID=A0A3R7RS40_TRYRA|nr:DNA-directed RNA polymerase subunit [Trypanosoma rangeli]RNF11755.1 DNA-directed RNA polymerase subunit [Trypanosoma rangeli]|eukprot:RNF11755.1 DNA-directed RNA polymerase subunit [Trypanosoma rangeli]
MQFSLPPFFSTLFCCLVRAVIATVNITTAFVVVVVVVACRFCLMLIPVRCYSCGKVIGNLYETYQQLLSEDYTEAEALNALQLDRMCCRRMILSHIDLVDDLLPYSVPVVGTMPLVNPLQTPTPHRR